MGGIAPSPRRLPLARHPLRLGDLIGGHLGGDTVAVLNRQFATEASDAPEAAKLNHI